MSRYQIIPRKSNCSTLSVGTLFSRRFKTGSESSGNLMELKMMYFVLVAFNNSLLVSSQVSE